LGEITEDRLRRVECGWVDRIERRKVGGDVQSEAKRVRGKLTPCQRSRASAGTKPVEHIVHLRAGKPAPDIEFILGLLEQLLPHVDRHDDTLRAAMRAEGHRLTIAAVESLGDLMKSIPGFPDGYYLGHASIVRHPYGYPTFDARVTILPGTTTDAGEAVGGRSEP